MADDYNGQSNVEALWMPRTPIKANPMPANISINPQQLAAFCQRHHIRRLSLFGSVLREDFRPDSDIDVLYVFDEDHNPGWDIQDIEAELSDMLGHRVEMVSERYLNRWIRNEVLDSAEVVYGQG